MAFPLGKFPQEDLSYQLAQAIQTTRQQKETAPVALRDGVATRMASPEAVPKALAAVEGFAAQAYDPKHPGKKDIENWMGAYMNGIYSPGFQDESAAAQEAA